jgi:hypothetical protein
MLFKDVRPFGVDIGNTTPNNKSERASPTKTDVNTIVTSSKYYTAPPKNQTVAMVDNVLCYMDRVHNFRAYFPHNNIESILKKRAFRMTISSVSPRRKSKLPGKRNLMDMMGVRSLFQTLKHKSENKPIVSSKFRKVNKDKSSSYVEVQGLSRSKSIVNSKTYINESQNEIEKVPQSAMIKPPIFRKKERKTTLERKIEEIKYKKSDISVIEESMENSMDYERGRAISNNDDLGTFDGSDVNSEDMMAIRKLKVITEKPENTEISPNNNKRRSSFSYLSGKQYL